MPKRILSDTRGVYDLAQVSAITKGAYVRGLPDLPDFVSAILHVNGQSVPTEIPLHEAISAWSDYVMTVEARRRLPATATPTDNSRPAPPPPPVDASPLPPAESPSQSG
jgi:hypothetical protein